MGRFTFPRAAGETRNSAKGWECGRQFGGPISPHPAPGCKNPSVGHLCAPPEHPHDDHRSGIVPHPRGPCVRARLADEEQTLVFGDILRTIYGLYSGELLLEDEEVELPEKVIIFVDELNKYAPARGEASKSPILEQVLDISERGRSFGIVLFSAQQFLSAVHPRVTGNAATKVLGRTDSVELSDSVYRFLDPDIKMHLTRLEKGELILSHPIYRQPVKVNFPKPPFRQGRVRT